jgi:hypothetical protein
MYTPTYIYFVVYFSHYKYSSLLIFCLQIFGLGGSWCTDGKNWWYIGDMLFSNLIFSLVEHEETMIRQLCMAGDVRFSRQDFMVINIHFSVWLYVDKHLKILLLRIPFSLLSLCICVCMLAFMLWWCSTPHYISSLMCLLCRFCINFPLFAPCSEIFSFPQPALRVNDN